MSMVLVDDRVTLQGECGAADAETLLAALLDSPGLLVDLTGAGPLHTAVVQVLMAVRPPCVGPASDPFTAAWILPALEAIEHPRAPSVI